MRRPSASVAALVFQSSHRPSVSADLRSTNLSEYCISSGSQSTSTASTSDRPEPAARRVLRLSRASLEVAAFLCSILTFGWAAMYSVMVLVTELVERRELEGTGPDALPVFSVLRHSRRRARPHALRARTVADDGGERLETGLRGVIESSFGLSPVEEVWSALPAGREPVRALSRMRMEPWLLRVNPRYQHVTFRCVFSRPSAGTSEEGHREPA